MKNTMWMICFLVLTSIGFNASAQDYKTAADTVKLNKEYTEVSNDIASLTAKVAIIENNMPQYRSKANTAAADAQDAAISSSNQADKATRGGVKEARKAKRESKKAYREAKDERSANMNISKQQDKLASLKGQLAAKQERLSQLDAMRNAIGSLNTNQ